MKKNIQKTISENEFILMEGAVVEILRRSGSISLHPKLIHSPLIYDQIGITEMRSIFESYIEISKEKNVPFIMCAPTWRANKENVLESGEKPSINIDAMHFMQNIRAHSGDFKDQIFIGGTVGPKNDCYTPMDGLSTQEAASFHEWQLDELKKGGADFIIAETVPNIHEALGIAKAASKLEIDYIISFVIGRNGKILDGSSLSEAIDYIDQNTSKKPLGYAVNCAHPSFLKAEEQPKNVFNRLIGYLANASSLDHCELENSDNIQMDSITEWGDEMLRLNRDFGIKILGGCCGTDQRHLKYLTANL